MSVGRPRLELVPPADAVGKETACGPLDGRSDDELMLLARGGSQNAFAALVRRHQGRALRVAARRMHRHTVAAADVVQSSFLEIYHALARYQPRGQFRSYLFRILLNQCRMVERAALIEDRHRFVGESSSAPSHEAEVLARERERELEAALGRLSAKLRDVILLRYTAELTYDEIASTLEIPIGTVKSRLYDAAEKLRQLMEAP